MAQQLPSDGNILGVDYGDKKTGLAIAGSIAKLPKPYGTISTDNVISKIKELIADEDIQLIAIGLPRSLEGNETQQSKKIMQFADELRSQIEVDIRFADETLSSVRARQYLKENTSTNMDVDSISACFILEELFKENGV